MDEWNWWDFNFGIMELYLVFILIIFSRLTLPYLIINEFHSFFSVHQMVMHWPGKEVGKIPSFPPLFKSFPSSSQCSNNFTICAIVQFFLQTKEATFPRPLILNKEEETAHKRCTNDVCEKRFKKCNHGSCCFHSPFPKANLFHETRWWHKQRNDMHICAQTMN